MEGQEGKPDRLTSGESAVGAAGFPHFRALPWADSDRHPLLEGGRDVRLKSPELSVLKAEALEVGA